MRRREFMGACAGAALTAAARRSAVAALPVPAPAEADGVPFSLTVTLWTVYRDLPFPQRLEKVVEAGYHAVELVGEYKDWKPQDFAEVPGRHHPGTGEINYSNIFRKLAELRYSRYVAMEFNPLGDAVKELRDARELAISSARSARVARSFVSGRKYESA